MAVAAVLKLMPYLARTASSYACICQLRPMLSSPWKRS